MSMQKPVVVGARGTNGMREQIIIDGENKCGVHINPYDPDDISWGIKQILKSEDKGLKMGINARKRAKEVFNWDIVNKKTLEIYNEFIV
jgi:glycosyltransferase involved in cell wall biosynthesis